jgi:ribosomal protein L17
MRNQGTAILEMRPSTTGPAAGAADNLVTRLCEHRVEGCELGDTPWVKAVVAELIREFGPGYDEIAGGFGRLYEYCLQKIREGEFTEVAWILSDLRLLGEAAGRRAATPAPGPSAGVV